MKRILEEESQENDEKTKEEKILAVWDLGSPLYDSYELVSISYLIERHLMILPSSGSRRLSTKIFPPTTSDNVAVPAILTASSAQKGTCDHRSSAGKSWREFARARLWRKGKRVGRMKDDKTKKVKGGVVGWLF